MMTTIRFDDNRGGLAYPFLPAALAWQITARSLGDEAALAEIFQADTPTLRWVKDDKVLDLHVPGMDTAVFLAHTGLKLSLDKGGYVLSKRLSRIMRPFRYWGFFADSDITIDYNPHLDGRLWDGSGQVSRGFIQRLADTLPLDERHRQELLSSGRFEVTTLHSGGQDKGHVLVVDDLAVDFMFPTGSAKQELRLANPSGDSGQASRTFIGLHPVHSDDQMCLDIQSLINLYPFFQPEQLLVWAEMESALFLDGIRSGRLERLLNRLPDMASLPDDAKDLADDAKDLADDALADAKALADADPDALGDGRDGWHVGEYIASGGRLMWFAGMVKAVARQHLNRLGSRASKLRLPVPGGRYYLFPAAVGRRQVPSGHVELDPASATAWVNDADWLETIVDVLGGCDGDDAVWVFPFSDLGDGRLAKLLLWRSPNQVGEYVLLRPTAASQPIAWETVAAPLVFPALNSRRLPPRIDTVAHQYGTLTAVGSGRDSGTAYTVAAMDAAIHQAAANQGVLGSHCNALMVCKAVYGRLPDSLPATLEAVIDGSVKSGLDLRPVKQWNSMALRRMARHGLVNPRRRLPETLLDRLPDWLRQTACDARQPASADSPPVDTGFLPVQTGFPAGPNRFPIGPNRFPTGPNRFPTGPLARRPERGHRPPQSAVLGRGGSAGGGGVSAAGPLRAGARLAAPGQRAAAGLQPGHPAGAGSGRHRRGAAGSCLRRGAAGQRSVSGPLAGGPTAVHPVGRGGLPLCAGTRRRRAGPGRGVVAVGRQAGGGKRPFAGHRSGDDGRLAADGSAR
ncbi:MAG: hypothetical protein IPH82_24700 [Chloroflexi bacterium]|nr:hypothetical protein [Chloroflexota bacterium]